MHGRHQQRCSCGFGLDSRVDLDLREDACHTRGYKTETASAVAFKLAMTWSLDSPWAHHSSKTAFCSSSSVSNCALRSSCTGLSLSWV